MIAEQHAHGAATRRSTIDSRARTYTLCGGSQFRHKLGE